MLEWEWEWLSEELLVLEQRALVWREAWLVLERARESEEPLVLE